MKTTPLDLGIVPFLYPLPLALRRANFQALGNARKARHGLKRLQISCKASEVHLEVLVHDLLRHELRPDVVDW
jgi:hypothetical protein